MGRRFFSARGTNDGRERGIDEVEEEEATGTEGGGGEAAGVFDAVVVEESPNRSSERVEGEAIQTEMSEKEKRERAKEVEQLRNPFSQQDYLRVSMV